MHAPHELLNVAIAWRTLSPRTRTITLTIATRTDHLREPATREEVSVYCWEGALEAGFTLRDNEPIPGMWPDLVALRRRELEERLARL